eukprot:3480610-Rhodomonas_salina.2
MVASTTKKTALISDAAPMRAASEVSATVPSKRAIESGEVMACGCDVWACVCACVYVCVCVCTCIAKVRRSTQQGFTFRA